MPERYHIRVANDSAVFSAGHFITLEQGVCEALHGHDYHVAVELAGLLGDQGYVVDFLAVQGLLQNILREVDHAVLLPTRHPLLRVTSNDRDVTVQFDERRWVLPRSDCRLLDLSNTTSELLARWIGLRLLEQLSATTGFRADTCRVEIREGRGQSATWDHSSKLE